MKEKEYSVLGWGKWGWKQFHWKHCWGFKFSRIVLCGVGNPFCWISVVPHVAEHADGSLPNDKFCMATDRYYYLWLLLSDSTVLYVGSALVCRCSMLVKMDVPFFLLFWKREELPCAHTSWSRFIYLDSLHVRVHNLLDVFSWYIYIWLLWK